jgi:hypothetical protein
MTMCIASTKPVPLQELALQLPGGTQGGEGHTHVATCDTQAFLCSFVCASDLPCTPDTHDDVQPAQGQRRCKDNPCNCQVEHTEAKDTHKWNTCKRWMLNVSHCLAPHP